MNVTLEVTELIVQPELNAVQLTVTPIFQTDPDINAPIKSISVNGVEQPIVSENVDIEVPINTSDLTNDSNFVSDVNYVHTDNNYDDAAVLEVAKIVNKSDTSHNHSLANLTERSYNSLTDKPNLSLLEDIIDVQLWRLFEPEGAIEGDLWYNLSAKDIEVFVEDAFSVIPFQWKIYLNKDAESDFYGKYFVYNGIELSIIPDGLVLGETNSTAFDGLRGKAAYDHSQIISGNPHGTTAANVGAEPTIVPTADTTPVDTDYIITKRGATWLKTLVSDWKTYFQTKLTFSTDIEADKSSTTKVSAIKYIYEFFATKSEIGDINTILDSINGEVV